MRAAIIAGARSKNNHLLDLQDNNNNRNKNNSNSNQDVNANSNSSLNATPTPTRPRLRPPSTKPLRPPLLSRDHNAMMRASTQKGSAPLTAKSGNANANTNMPPYDHKHNASRPLMPTLSASAKVSHRPAITPRVAGSAPSPNPNTHTTPLPLSRRQPRAGAGAGGDSGTPTTPASKEDLSTPISAFLNNNITPRSGSRKSRVDSVNTTPTGTPNGTSAPLSVNESPGVLHDTPSHGPGLGISGMDKDLPKRPTVSFNTAASEVGGYPRNSTSSTTASSKFFFASDAKAAPPPRPVLQSKTSSNFFYANGESIPSPPQSSSASAVGSSVAEERGQPKFFHANGTPDLQLSPSPYFAPPRPSSTVSSSSRVTTARAPTSSPGTLSPPQRPLSPSKLSQQASIASLRNTPPLPSPVLPRPQTGGRGQPPNSLVAARRSSIEVTPRVSSHGRSASTGSTGSSLRKVSGASSVEVGPPSTPLNLTTAELVSTPEEPLEAESDDAISSVLPQSPIKSGHSLEQLNELAANARRERKVLDLEITNSSLAAINRTLEREMRKQTAELRRYRRLSRSGRLSIATTTSLRSSTGTLSSIGADGEGIMLSDMSEEEEDESEISDDETDSMDDGSLSPAAMAESDLRHRRKDEKRLQLDLSKHQQLLIDSQKMNQGLKRCLDWTEALISEGRKALEYHVRVSDVELGGRVLAPDEVEEPMDNEGLSDIGAELLREARMTVPNKIVPWGGDRRDDRDSGIVLEGAQREAVATSTVAPKPPAPPQ
ncbi:Uncharacterized protein BP5553_03150 [Venustampulla echinocandica]|uniref:Uncharacterized protein n=1 Tax=Venustampulla echinocandica TaxID=2656787 RepID=A0A370TTG1_9HELO|nr:Uncharacterized protein BP5553_03150 [Venustampulla echinocandica]RDL38810.1 Uncharacterized protein BP5553_03150 [Venustampulla echinocandica]